MTRPTRLVEHRCSVLPASVPVDLTWSAPAECPARDIVLGEVSRVLSTSNAPRVPIAARVDVSRDEQGRWHATLSLDTRDAHSERTLDAEGCPAIASATAVIVAIAVEGGMPEQPARAPAPPAAQHEGQASTRARGGASQAVAAVAGALDGGTLPVISPGVELALGWAYSWSTWRLRALASTTFFLAQNTSPLLGGDAAGEVGHFDLFVASARVCGSLVRDAFDFGPCLGLEIDWMTGTGEAGPAHPDPSTAKWVSALGSLLASWSFSRHVAIVLRGEGFYAPATPDFGVNDPLKGTPIHVYSPRSIGARGALGVEARFF